ncbi:TRAP transporter small permease [Chryseomicrobium palamuruense]|uniref:TRAP transporter small permease n=1 Tax=Chryseomicrobium palamuruense TaxID=682973 RepID=A0ABV8UW13_9BACL
MSSVEKIAHWFRIIGISVASFAIAAMVLMIVVDVTMRNVFKVPIQGTYEVVQYFLMPLAIFPTLAFAYQSGVLPRLSELIEKLPKRFQQVNRIIIYALELVVFLLLTYYSILFALSGIQDQMAIPVAGNLLPVYPLYMIVPISFAAVVLEVVLSIYRTYFKKIGDVA